MLWTHFLAGTIGFVLGFIAVVAIGAISINNIDDKDNEKENENNL